MTNYETNKEFVMETIKEKLNETDLMGQSVDLLSSMIITDVMDITVSFQMQRLMAALKGPKVSDAMSEVEARTMALLTKTAGDLISDYSTTTVVAYAQAYGAAKETLRYSEDYLKSYPFEKEVTMA